MIHNLLYFVRPRTIQDFGSTFTAVADAGIEHVVLAPQMGEVDFLNREDALNAGRLLNELGIKPLGTHGLHGEHLDLNEPDDALRPRMIDMHLRLMDHMAELGCLTYVCHPGSAPEAESRHLAWDRVRRALDELAPHAHSLGLIIAVENGIPGHLSDNAAEMLSLLGGYRAPDVGICYDSGHAHWSEDATSVLTALLDHVVTVHLHDNDGASDTHLIPGHGTIDWKAFVPLLADCPRLVHLETEAFNTEGWHHRDVYGRYRDILSDPTAATDAAGAGRSA